MATPERPLSPHLQIYRRQITSVMSILHRITGVVLAFGAFGLAWWLFVLSETNVFGSVHFMDFNQFIYLAVSIPGQIVIAGFSYCLIYHFLNGLRHLFWDVGRGVEIKHFQRSGWAVVVLSLLLTAGLWAIAMPYGGAP